MAHVIADRVLESSVSAGAGPFTLAGAVLGFRAFSAVCAVTDTVPYYIEAVDDVGRPTGDYEFGLGTYSAANQLTRTTVRGSSNGGLAVVFAAGNKLVGLGIPAPASSAARAEWRASLGLTAIGEAVATAASQAAAQTAIGVVPREVGEIADFLRASVPAGWIKASGSIGSAASGATTRANADTQALFTLWWNDFSNAVLPIQDSAGVATTRGASAAADFAANKRLPVFDIRGLARRGWDDGRGVDAGRVLGSEQLDAMQGHVHSVSSGSSSQTPDSAGIPKPRADTSSNTGNPLSDGINGVPRIAAETRMRNIAVLVCIKL